MKIAVIPARGGSKRIPRKNIKVFAGRPMIGWAIEVVKKSEIFDQIIVSTDDAEIAETAITFGADVPFVRPAEISDDTAGTVPVIAHAVSHLQGLGKNIDFACCIYPCCPFLQPDDLHETFAELVRSDAEFAYPVLEYAHPTFRAMRRRSNGSMEFIFPDCEMKRTQDLELTYHDAGQFYWGRAEAWTAEKRMHTAGIGHVMPAWRFVDVDTEDDWRRAELYFRVLRGLNS